MAVGGLAFGTCQASRATDAEIRLQDALTAQKDSASHWRTAREGLTVRLQTLQRDSGVLALNLARATGAAQRASQRAESLFLRLPDTLRVGVRLVFDSLAGETIACRGMLMNAEARGQNCEQRARGDSIQLTQTVRLLLQTEAAWHIEQQKNRPGFLGLRSFWHARSWTIPLAAISALLILRR